MKKLKVFILENKFFVATFLTGLAWELFVFWRLPKQAFVEGLLESWYTSKGLVFYKDFINQYFPFLHLLLIPFHQIFGYTQEVSILLAPANSIILFILLAVFSAKFFKGWHKVIPLAFFLFWNAVLSENHFTPNSFQATTNFLVFIFWWRWYKKPNKLFAFLIGFFLSASFLTVHVVAFFVAAVAFSIFFRAFRDKKHFDSLVAFTIGFLLPVIYIVIWFVRKGALYELYYRNIAYYFSDYPFTRFGKNLDSAVLFSALCSPILLIIYARPKFDIFLLLTLVGLPIGIWFAIFHPMRFLIFLPISAFILGMGTEFVSQEPKKRRKRGRVLVGLIIALNLLSFFYYILPKYKSSFRYPRKYNILSKVYEHDPMFKGIEWIKENTPEDAKLFVLDDPLYYLETNRLPSHSRATHNEPYTYEPLGTLKEEIKQNPPDYWVVDERLLKDRFHEFDYSYVSEFFEKILDCQTIVAQIEYLTIRKHDPENTSCF